MTKEKEEEYREVICLYSVVCDENLTDTIQRVKKRILSEYKDKCKCTDKNGIFTFPNGTFTPSDKNEPVEKGVEVKVKIFDEHQDGANAVKELKDNHFVIYASKNNSRSSKNLLDMFFNSNHHLKKEFKGKDYHISIFDMINPNEEDDNDCNEYKADLIYQRLRYVLSKEYGIDIPRDETEEQ